MFKLHPQLTTVVSLYSQHVFNKSLQKFIIPVVVGPRYIFYPHRSAMCLFLPDYDGYDQCSRRGVHRDGDAVSLSRVGSGRTGEPGEHVVDSAVGCYAYSNMF